MALSIISPLFGIVLAEKTGYHEPLDIAAEKLGLHEKTLYHTPLQEYRIPGVNPLIAYAATALLGALAITAAGCLAAKVARK